MNKKKMIKVKCVSESDLILDTVAPCELLNSYEQQLPLLTIVIPIYKTKMFLNRCLESVLAQTYRNLEIICVDDASTENEWQIVEEYRKTDPRIRLVRHKKNRGLFQTRITGMKYATGDYFAFLDSDDHVSIDFYRILINKGLNTDADIVIGDFADEYEDGRLEYYNYDNTRFKDIDLKDDEIYSTFLNQHGLWFGWHTVWNKIYKKTIWNEAFPHLNEFSEKHGHLIMTEDIAFSCVFWKFAKHVVNTHNAIIYYFHHAQQSVSNSNFSKFEKNANDVASVMTFFKEFLQNQNIFDKYIASYQKFLDAYIEFWTINADPLPTLEQERGRELIKKLFGRTIPYNYKDHFHYSLRSSLATFSWYEAIKNDICSKEITTVSFDIFDTLLLRPFFKPSDMFFLLNEKFNKMVNSTAYLDFHKFRMDAEAELRNELKHTFEEITLDDIYSCIGDLFQLSNEQVENLKQTEKELEQRFIEPRKCGLELYLLARSMGKKVVCTSDIYLDKDTINAMLNKCGFTPDNLYLSSEYLVTKSTGNLYLALLEQEKIEASKMVHIGDNWNSDVAKPQSLSIKSHFLPSPVYQFTGLNCGIYTGNSFSRIFGESGKQYMGSSAVEHLGIRCMLAIVANKIFDNPYLTPFNGNTDFNSNPYFIGYYALGMHLYAVTDWICNTAENDGRETIHYVSRDGYLPKKAFEIFKKHNNIKVNSNYLHISRKASALLQNSSLADIQSFVGSFSSYKNIPVKTVWDTFSTLAKNDLKTKNFGNKLGFTYFGRCKDFKSSLELGKFVFESLLDKEKVTQFTQTAQAYFKNIIKPNDILFDLGYRGNKEYILSSLIGRPVDCLYVYSNESNALARAIYKGFSLRTFYDYTPSVLAAAREIMFSEQGPSCIGYDAEHGMQAIFEDKDENHYFNKFAIETMQQAALDFIEDFEHVFAGTDVKGLYRKFDASLPYEYFLHYAPKTDRDIFSCITFEDDVFAGTPSKMIDDWEGAINFHHLNKDVPERVQVTTTVGVAPTAQENVQIVSPLPGELENLYTDGLFVKAFQKINRMFPPESKKRERMKRFVGIFIH